MASNDGRQLADDTHPRLVNCQKCSAEFDWQEAQCPECGWDRSEWVENGRYGLGDQRDWS